MYSNKTDWGEGIKIKRGGGWIFLLNLINGGFKINGGGQNFKKSVNIGNERKKRQTYLMLMLNLKVSKQTRSEANKTR